MGEDVCQYKELIYKTYKEFTQLNTPPQHTQTIQLNMGRGPWLVWLIGLSTGL